MNAPRHILWKNNASIIHSSREFCDIYSTVRIHPRTLASIDAHYINNTHRTSQEESVPAILCSVSGGGFYERRSSTIVIFLHLTKNGVEKNPGRFRASFHDVIKFSTLGLCTSINYRAKWFLDFCISGYMSCTCVYRNVAIFLLLLIVDSTTSSYITFETERGYQMYQAYYQ